MVMEGKEITAYLRKGILVSVRTSYKSVRDHPFVFCVLVFALLLYRSCPSFFAFLVSSSPVIICTALLLGTLLSYSDPNIPEVELENKKTHDISSLKTRSVSDDVVFKKDESFNVESHVESSRGIELKATKAVAMHTDDEDDDEDDEELEEEEEEEEEEVGDTYIVEKPSVVAEKEESHLEVKVTEDTAETREFSEEKITEDLPVVGEDSIVNSTKDQIRTEGFKVEVDRLASENLLDSPLGLCWQPIHREDDSSDSESDRAESSSPDASMADIIPMFDELHPLLYSEDRQPAQDHGSQDGSADEAENHEDEEDEGRNEKDDGEQVPVTWTADDQKNLMDLGSSELERNQRLESLIAKRRAMQNRRFEARKNQIDLDSSDTAPIMEHLSHLLVQIPRISASRRNPFDLSYDSEENTGLPPIPCSAPSVLLPGRNPFDFPYDHVEESSRITSGGSSHPEFVKASQRDMLFYRHESFAAEPSFSGQLKPKRRDSKLKPYFIPERMDSDETNFTIYQRQSGGLSDLIVSSVPDSDSVSSVTDQEDHKQSLEQEFHYEGEHLNHDHLISEFFKLGNHSSLEADVIKGTHLETNASGAVEKEAEFISPILESGKEKYDDRSASSSLEMAEKSSRMSSGGEPEKMKEITGKEDWTVGSNLASGMTAETSRIGSPPRPVEKETVSADEDLVSFVGSTGEDLMAESQGSSVASSNLCSVDENESRSREVSEVREEDVIGIGFFKKFGDLNDTVAPQISHPASSQLMQHSSLSSVENESTESSPTDVEENLQNKAYEIVGITSSFQEKLVDELTSTNSGKAHESMINPACSFKEPPISILDLPSIPEEKPEDVKLEEEHHFIINPTTNVAVSGLQRNEDHYVSMSDTEQELSSLPSKCLVETGDVDNINRQLVEADSSVASQLVPLHDHSVTGLSFLEKKGDGYLIDLNSDIINEVQCMNDDGFLDKPSDLEEESEKIHAEVQKLVEIDESLLSELDVVGDFHIDELKLDQIGSNRDSWPNDQSDKLMADFSISSTMQDVFPLLQISEVGSTEGITNCSKSSPEAFSNNLNEMESLMDQVPTMEAKVGSLSWPHSEDPELTVYNSKLHVLDACSLEEIDSIYKKLSQETSVTSFSEVALDKLNIPQLEVESSEVNITDRDREVHETDPELLVIEAKSVDDLNYAFKQLSEGSSDISPRMPVELMGGRSNLTVIEAMSLEDRHLALMQLTDSTVDKPPTTVELSVGSAEVLTNEIHQETELLEDPNVREAILEQLATEANSKEVSGLVLQEYPEGALCEVGALKILHVESMRTPSDLHVVEAASLQDIHFAFKQFSEIGTESLLESTECEDDCTEVQEHNGHMEHEVLDKSQLTETDTNLLVLEAKSINDIKSAFERVSKGDFDIYMSPEIGSSELLVDGAQMEPIETQSDMQVVEAKSLEDIHLALKVLSESSTENLPKPAELNVTVEGEHQEPNVLADVDLIETGSEMVVLEAKSIEDYSLAFKHGDEVPNISHCSEVGQPESRGSTVHVEPLGTQSDMQVVEAKSLEDIHLALRLTSESSRPRDIEEGPVGAETSKTYSAVS